MTPEARESVLRLLWQATMPKAAWIAVFGCMILLQGWWTWHRSDHSLATLASDFRMPILLLGYILLFTPFTSGRSTPLAGNSDPGPGAIAVAQPVLTGLGAACLGFGVGLNVIGMLSHDQRWSDSRGLTITWVVIIALGLAAAIRRVTGVTRRLYAWSQDAAAAAATAQTVADRARIAALQAQMNPHFLFNALNTVASLLGRDSTAARRTLQNLSSMLTHTLERSAEPLATVEAEVQFARDYLDIEHERFGSRLQVTYAIDPNATGLTVPTMSLQPLVENAVKHAIANRLEGGRIRISATKLVHGSSVRLSVEDDGPGFAAGSEDGTGLANLRARLRSLYGPHELLTVEILPAGARVSITIPHYARSDR
jgi:hypothetical protein